MFHSNVAKRKFNFVYMHCVITDGRSFHLHGRPMQGCVRKVLCIVANGTVGFALNTVAGKNQSRIYSSSRIAKNAGRITRPRLVA